MNATLTPPRLNPSPLWGEGRVRGVCENPRDYARQLRQAHNPIELTLWFHLRDRRLDGFKFRRQHPIGPYIVDFCCPEAWLAIELDGGQHALRRDADARRTEFLVAQGYRVLRFWNNEVSDNLQGVLYRIRETLSRCHPHPDPLPGRERGLGPR